MARRQHEVVEGNWLLFNQVLQQGMQMETEWNFQKKSCPKLSKKHNYTVASYNSQVN